MVKESKVEEEPITRDAHYLALLRNSRDKKSN